MMVCFACTNVKMHAVLLLYIYYCILYVTNSSHWQCLQSSVLVSQKATSDKRADKARNVTWHSAKIAVHGRRFPEEDDRLIFEGNSRDLRPLCGFKHKTALRMCERLETEQNARHLLSAKLNFTTLQTERPLLLTLLLQRHLLYKNYLVIYMSWTWQVCFMSMFVLMLSLLLQIKSLHVSGARKNQTRAVFDMINLWLIGILYRFTLNCCHKKENKQNRCFSNDVCEMKTSWNKWLRALVSSLLYGF